MGIQKTPIIKKNLEKKELNWTNMLLDFRRYTKGIVVRTVWQNLIHRNLLHFYKQKQITKTDQWDRIESPETTHVLMCN